MEKRTKRQGRPPMKKGKARTNFHAVVLNQEELWQFELTRKCVGGRSVSDTYRKLVLEYIVRLRKINGYK